MVIPNAESEQFHPGQIITAPVEQPIRWRFVPLEDITAYEFAVLHPFLHGLAPIFDRTWIDLGSVTRHLEKL